MRPLGDDRPIEMLREALPEFEPFYLDLLDIYDEDLTVQVVFNELADYVTGILAGHDEPDDVLERCFSVLETITAAGGTDAVEAVGFSFLDALDEATVAQVRHYLGRATSEMLDRLEADELSFDDEDAR
jgi:hypothetical protein